MDILKHLSCFFSSSYGGTRGSYRGGSSGYRGGSSSVIGSGSGSDSSWRGGGRGGSSFNSSRPIGASSGAAGGGGASSRYYASTPLSSYDSRTRSSYVGGGTSATDRYSNRRDDSYSRYPDMSSYGSRDYGRIATPEPARKRVRGDSPAYMALDGPLRYMADRDAKVTKRPVDTSEQERIIQTRNEFLNRNEFSDSIFRESHNNFSFNNQTEKFEICPLHLFASRRDNKGSTNLYDLPSNKRFTPERFPLASGSSGEYESNFSPLQSISSQISQRPKPLVFGFPKPFGLSYNYTKSDPPSNFPKVSPSQQTQMLQNIRFPEFYGSSHLLSKLNSPLSFSKLGPSHSSQLPKPLESNSSSKILRSALDFPEHSSNKYTDFSSGKYICTQNSFALGFGGQPMYRQYNGTQRNSHHLDMKNLEHCAEPVTTFQKSNVSSHSMKMKLETKNEKKISRFHRRKLKKLASLKGSTYKELYKIYVLDDVNRGEKSWIQKLEKEIEDIKHQRRESYLENLSKEKFDQEKLRKEENITHFECHNLSLHEDKNIEIVSGLNGNINMVESSTSENCNDNTSVKAEQQKNVADNIETCISDLTDACVPTADPRDVEHEKNVANDDSSMNIQGQIELRNIRRNQLLKTEMPPNFVEQTQTIKSDGSNLFHKFQQIETVDVKNSEYLQNNKCSETAAPLISDDLIDLNLKKQLQTYKLQGNFNIEAASLDKSCGSASLSSSKIIKKKKKLPGSQRRKLRKIKRLLLQVDQNQPVKEDNKKDLNLNNADNVNNNTELKNEKRMSVTENFNKNLPITDVFCIKNEAAGSSERQNLDSFLNSLRSSNTSSHSSEFFVNILVRDESNALGKIVEDNVKIFEKALVEKIVNGLAQSNLQELSLNAQGLDGRNGNYKFECFNEYSYNWLQSVINSFQNLWYGANLKLKKFQDCKLWKTSIFVPDIFITAYQFLTALNKQYPTLKTGKWYLRHYYKKKSGQFFVFSVDFDSLEELERMGFWANYGSNRLRFHKPRNYVSEDYSFTKWYNKAKMIAF